MLPEFAGIVINKKIEATDRIYTYIIPEELRGRLKCGMTVRVPFGPGRAEGVVVELADSTEVTRLRRIEAVLSEEPLFDEAMLRLSEFIAEHYMCPRFAALQAMLPAALSLSGALPRAKSVNCCYITEAAPVFSAREKKQAQAFDMIRDFPGITVKELAEKGVSAAVLNALREKSLIRLVAREIYEETAVHETAPAELSEMQKQVFDGLDELRHAGHGVALLHGVTGSGKTEIYLRLAQKVIEEGRQVLLLVPEIALTPQMVDFVSRRLAVKVAVMHSAMNPAERQRIWHGISSGEYPVVLGARSAVFAPLHNPGLIIVDEEQENSYKQENVPRFHAREVARERARISDILLLLGSATPSLESYHKAQSSEYKLFELTERFHQPLLPRVQIVDMREELASGNRSMFSAALQQHMADRLERGEQILLFLNRRGFYTFFSCRSCGEVIKCPHCSVPLAYHEREGLLKCHYCDHHEALPQLCPKCGSSAIRHFGTGTQRVAAEAQRLFPQARILRLDRDVTAKKGAHEEIYRKMRDHEADILVGTQMIAKGLDFPDVTLSAVMAADSLLNQTDWRAAERTFQLLTQMIGRAGRRDKRGDALIQTYMPEHHVIKAASAQDYALFARQEDAMRQMALYPPYCSMLYLLFVSEELPCLELFVGQAAGYLRGFLSEEDFMGGPAPAAPEKLQDKWRYQIFLKGPDGASLRRAVQQMLDELQKNRLKPKNVLIHINVDPM